MRDEDNVWHPKNRKFLYGALLIVAILFLLALLPGCGGKHTSPTPVQQVGGSYNGKVHWTVGKKTFEDQLVTVRVDQIGTQLKLSGRIHFPLQPSNLPTFNCVLDGACTPGVDAPDMVCEKLQGVLATVAFRDGDLLITEDIVTPLCSAWHMEGRLTR